MLLFRAGVAAVLTRFEWIFRRRGTLPLECLFSSPLPLHVLTESCIRWSVGNAVHGGRER